MSKRTWLSVGALLLAIIIGVGITWALKGTGSAEPRDRVSVRMKWFFAGTMTGWFFGFDQGSYSDEGIDLEINPGGPQNKSITLVAAGSDDFGVAGADEVILARAQGVPVVAIGVLFKENPVCYVSRVSKNILTPDDWREKTIEVSYGENSEYLFRALLARYDIGAADFIEVPYSFSIVPFLEDAVDVSPAYAMDQAVLIEREGIPIRRLFPQDFGVSAYGDVIFAREETLEEQPELVRRFLRAVLDGHTRAIANPSPAVSYLSEIIRESSVDDLHRVWLETIPFISPQDPSEPIGHMTHDRWEETQQVLLDSGALSFPIDLTLAFTNIFLPDEPM